MEKINFLIFLILAFFIIIPAIMAIFARKIVHSVLFAALSFFSVAFLFMSLNADFVGVAQIFVYGIGVSILLAFSIMFTAKEEETKLYLANNFRVFAGFLAVFILLGTIAFFFAPDLRGKELFLVRKPSVTQVSNLLQKGTPKIIGRRIFCDYVLPFELLSLLLLAGLVGAGYLAAKENEDV